MAERLGLWTCKLHAMWRPPSPIGLPPANCFHSFSPAPLAFVHTNTTKGKRGIIIIIIIIIMIGIFIWHRQKAATLYNQKYDKCSY